MNFRAFHTQITLNKKLKLDNTHTIRTARRLINKISFADLALSFYKRQSTKSSNLFFV